MNTTGYIDVAAETELRIQEAVDAAISDFRTRAIQLCKSKAAEYERAMRNRQTREAFTKTYADAANEIREALEAQ